MFLYLSFLRPPPIQAPLHGTISITPQISNDLRTEPFEGTQDIYNSWVLHSSPSNSISQSTKPVKLTTWRPSSAYREIPVPIPPNVREGQQWRLVLTCQAQGYGNGSPECIDLEESSIGSIPFPVMSMPVLFSSIGGKREGKGKQEMIERTYLLPFMTHSQDQGIERTIASLRFLERTSYDLDKKIWDSGIGLSSWICELKENNSLVESHKNLAKVRSTLFSDERCKILELGSGIGMVSVALAVIRSGMPISSSLGEDRDVILATDVYTAMPLLQQNISANSRYCPSVTPQALVLDWDEALPPEVYDLGGLDIVVMADVSYNTSSFPALARTLSNLVRLGPKPPFMILGYKERDEAERTFWNTAAQIGIYFEKVGERKGAGGAPVEIWLGVPHLT